MRNSFAGQCYRCGKRVEAGAGHFERFGARQKKLFPTAPRSINWLTQHAECAIQYRGTSHSIWDEEHSVKTISDKFKNLNNQ